MHEFTFNLKIKVKAMAKQNKKCLRCLESNWINPDINFKEAQFITAGIDVGSVNSKACIMADGQIYAYSNMRSDYHSQDSAQKALDFTLENTNLTIDSLDYIIGTGYGRVKMPLADRTLTEIACHARGAKFIYGPSVHTILDVGGQDIKAIHCDDKGKVENFLINDKCAIGTGLGMEVFADLLGVPVNDVGDRSFQVNQEPEPISESCVVYAKAEALGLLRKGSTTEEILAAFCRTTAEQIFPIIERVGLKEDVAVTGGMAKNRGVMDRLMSMLGIERLTTNWDPQIAGACGAALFGHALCQKGKGRKK